MDTDYNDDIMLDLETMDTSPTAAIISIGACTLDCRRQLKFNVDLLSCTKAGLTTSVDTDNWWRQPERQELFNRLKEDTLPLRSVLELLSTWIRCGIKHARDMKIYGNGSDFDNVILRNAYNAVGLKAPWNHRNNRCYRTLKNLQLSGGAFAVIPPAIPHDPLSDALSQAEHCLRILDAISGITRKDRS